VRLPDFLRQRDDPTITLGDRALPLLIRRLRHARRFTLRLTPDGTAVRVSVPWHARGAEAVAFAQSHVGWLTQQLERVPAAHGIAPGEPLAYRGQALLVIHDPASPRRPQLEPGAVRAGGTVESLPRRLRKWLEDEARRILQQDLADYCARAGVPLAPLALSNANRRWGSCSARGNIRLNWRLIMAPDHVRRSVVAHEVAHLVHFDHSPRFHALLDQLYEGHMPAANRWLKREGRTLYAAFG